MEELHIPEEITTLGGAIRWARERRGMTITDLACKLDCSVATITNIELGKAGTLWHWELAANLGVPVAELHGRKRGPHADVARERAERIAARQRARHQRLIPREAPAVVAAPDDQTAKEQALTLGLRGETTRIYRGCNYCHDMSWRRPADGCRGCGAAFAPEHVGRAEPQYGSASVMCMEVAIGSIGLGHGVRKRKAKAA